MGVTESGLGTDCMMLSEPVIVAKLGGIPFQSQKPPRLGTMYWQIQAGVAWVPRYC